MDDTIATGIISFICGALLTFVWMIGLPSDARDAMYLQAIDHGVAEYYIDDNNDRQFRWLGDVADD